VQRAGAELHELDVMAVGIVNVKATVAILHRLELVWHLNALAAKVGPHLFGIRGFKRNMGQPVHLGVGKLREHLDVLMVVDLEIRQQQARAFAGRFVQTEGLLEAQNSGVKLAGSRQIVRFQSNVSDSDDGRPGDRGCLRRVRVGGILGKRDGGQKGRKVNPASSGLRRRGHGQR
jgi:hypothetical protein